MSRLDPVHSWMRRELAREVVVSMAVAALGVAVLALLVFGVWTIR